MHNPGRLGDWKLLRNAKRGDKGMDWPWSADKHTAKVVLKERWMIGLLATIPATIGNKEWVCMTDGRIFLYHHDGEDRVLVLKNEE